MYAVLIGAGKFAPTELQRQYRSLVCLILNIYLKKIGVKGAILVTKIHFFLIISRWVILKLNPKLVKNWLIQISFCFEGPMF